MSQITLYLDEATQSLVDQAALAHGISKSRWVAEAIRRYVAHDWPPACLDLAGSFPDFPLVSDSTGNEQPEDTPRVGF